MNELEQKIFDALCHVVIYHFCDLCHKQGDENSKASKLLISQGIIEDWDNLEFHQPNAARAYEKYEQMVVEYAEAHLPKDWQRTYDYWGAVCFSNQKGWNAPKSNTLYAGDTCGKIMLFESYEALKQYTEEKLEQMTNEPA